MPIATGEETEEFSASTKSAAAELVRATARPVRRE
jgi:hypothetical protein